MGKIKKITENELVGGTQNTDVYPVTSVKAVYDESNERLDNILNRSRVVNISTNYNADHIAETLTLEQAITKVPLKDRVLGFQCKFLSENGWKSYIFIGDSIADWTNKTKWNNYLTGTDVVQELGESEDKVMSQKAVSAELNKKLIFKTDNSSADFSIGDNKGNVILRLENGHIKTKNFDSEKVLSEKDLEDKINLFKTDNSSADFSIGDPNGNVIVQFKNGHIKTKNFDSEKNNGMTETSYEGEKLSIKKNSLFFKILDGMPSSYNGSAQAAGMFNNYIVRLYDGGWCTICKLNEDDSVTLLQKFALKTQGFTKNHAGSGGFDFVKHDGDDFPYMVYGNSTLPIWYVENIHLNGTSELLQTINVTNVGPEGRWYNVHPTEDGYYLFFNIDKATGKNVFIAKMRKPSLSEGSEVTLTERDIVDSFTISLDKFIEMQDGCVYDGKLWFAFSNGNGGDIKIFELNSHKMTHIIPINMIPNELEDLCIYNDYLWVFYAGTSKYLKIKFD